MKRELCVILFLNMVVFFTNAAWYDTSWQYRKLISIDYTKVPSLLSNFPVLIDITDSDLASNAQSDGDDILFTASDGVTKLPHEIESYDSSTGHLVAWVKVPTLYSSDETRIYMYYGNPTASNQENASAVWDSNYVVVQHMEETDVNFYDSTSYANNGMLYGVWRYCKPITISNTGSALTDYQIKIQNPVYNENGLVASWHFDEGSGNVASDTSGYNNHGTINGATWVSGKFGNALSFDGVDDNVVVANNDSLSITGALTVEAWIYRPVAWNPADGHYHAILSKGSIYNIGYGLEIYERSADSSIRPEFWIRDASGADLCNVVYTDTSWGVGEWKHLVGVYDGSNIYLYEDGNLVCSKATTITPGATNNAFVIGDDNGAEVPWLGYIDEVRVYNRALSEAEVQALYEAKAKLNYDDIRFVDSNGSKLSYWFETDGNFWVKVPSIPSGNKTIYVCYGNSQATSDSNIEAVFSYSTPQTVGYVVAEKLDSSGLTVISLANNNTICAGDVCVDLNAQDTYTFSATDIDQNTPIKAKKLFHADGPADNTDMINPISWAGTEFYYRMYRGTNRWSMCSPFGTANVTIYDSGSPVWSGTVTSVCTAVTVDINNGDVVRIASDIPILVQHHSTESYDSRVLYPATSNILYGIPSNIFEIGAGPSGASVNWIRSDGSMGSINLSANAGYVLGSLGAFGSAPAFMVMSNNPIGVDQLADSDGVESTTFLPLVELGTIFGSANPAGYIAVAAPYPSTTCTVYDSTGSAVATQTGGNERINKLCFGCGSSTTWISGGWKMVCDKPVFAYYENDVVSSDETNLFSYKQMRKFAYPEPTISMGSEQILLWNGSEFASVSGKISSAISFDGSDDYIAIPDDTSLDMGSGNFSIELWVKHGEITDHAGYVVKGRSSRSEAVDGWPTYSLRHYLTKPVFFIEDGSTDVSVHATTVTEDNNWHYVVGVREGSYIKIYIDGSLENQSDASSVGSTDNSEALVIGRQTSVGGIYLDGIIDEVRVSNKARSADWITTSYNNQNSPSTFYVVSLQETSPGNSYPTINLNSPAGGENISGSYTIGFFVEDDDIQSQADGTLFVSIAYSSSPLSFENAIVSDANIYNTALFSCEDYNFTDPTYCTYTWDTTAITDGYYYLDINVRDDYYAYDNDSTASSFIVDNTAPQTTDNAPTTPQTLPFTITLTCSDNLSGCSTTYYRVDLGSWQEGNEVSIVTDGNHRIDYYSVDNAGNIEAVNTIYVVLNFAGTHTFSVVIRADGNYRSDALYVRNYISGQTVDSVASQTITSSSNIGYALFQSTSRIFGLVSTASCYEISITNVTPDVFDLNARQYVLPNREFYFVFTPANYLAVERRMDAIESLQFLTSRVAPSFAYRDKAYEAHVGLSYAGTTIDLNSNLHLGPGTYTLLVQNAGVSNNRIVINISRS